MKLCICGSLNFTDEMKVIADRLKSLGHEVILPPSSVEILKGEYSLDDIRAEKELGSFSERAIKHDAIRRYFKEIKDADGILVANLDKHGVKNYIGGNTFLEMGFAHVLGKRIFLLNDVPSMRYKDELLAMQPVILNDDFSRIL